jgi:hypothetical protein
MRRREIQGEHEPYALPGVRVWKSHAEYSTRPVIIGTPYWQITREEIEEKEYYLWELDTTSRKYHLLRASVDFDELYKEGDALDRKKGEERAAADPFRLR